MGLMPGRFGGLTDLRKHKTDYPLSSLLFLLQKAEYRGGGGLNENAAKRGQVEKKKFSEKDGKTVEGVSGIKS